jgi:hypothetical protein
MVADGREDLIGRIELEGFIALASENIRHSLSCAATSRIKIIGKILGLFCDFAIYACISICARLPEKFLKTRAPERWTLVCQSCRAVSGRIEC